MIDHLDALEALCNGYVLIFHPPYIQFALKTNLFSFTTLPSRTCIYISTTPSKAEVRK